MTYDEWKKPRRRNTYKQLKDFIDILPNGRADIFYRTESFKFLCDKIDQLEAMIEKGKGV